MANMYVVGNLFVQYYIYIVLYKSVNPQNIILWYVFGYFKQLNINSTNVHEKIMKVETKKETRRWLSAKLHCYHTGVTAGLR